MTSRRIQVETIHLPRNQVRAIGKQEGTLPKQRKKGLAQVIPLRSTEETPIHGSCQGCQMCICARLERATGDKWHLNAEGVPVRTEDE